MFDDLLCHTEITREFRHAQDYLYLALTLAILFLVVPAIGMM